ncbi:MAG: DNA-binding response regulator [Proteobacteria bacterium]|nr:DNA-binding response regulator [Pseudomonadota bacterium]
MGKLLVVEDHALVRESLVAALRRFRRGAEVFEAKDAELAIRWLDDNPDVDLLLLDLMLPGMDGFSFLGVLRKRFAAVPVPRCAAQAFRGSSGSGGFRAG